MHCLGGDQSMSIHLILYNTSAIFQAGYSGPDCKPGWSKSILIGGSGLGNSGGVPGDSGDGEGICGS